MNPLLKLAGHVAVGLIMNQRAKHSLARSLDDEEKVLRQVGATIAGAGFFGGNTRGYLCVTTQAVRFEKSKTINGRAAYGSIVMPLPQIHSVVAKRGRWCCSSLSLATGDDSREFFLDFAAYADELKALIHQARGW